MGSRRSRCTADIRAGHLRYLLPLRDVLDSDQTVFPRSETNCGVAGFQVDEENGGSREAREVEGGTVFCGHCPTDQVVSHAGSIYG